MAFNMHPATTQVRYPFNGNLNPNEVFGSIYNMIINQYVKSPKLVNNYSFVENFRTEGSMFGDTILIYDQDILPTTEWNGDLEATDLLATARPADPECQAITLNKFRKVKTTVDSYLSKRAWSTPTAFTDFNNIVVSMLGQSKKIYEVSLINTFLGSLEGEAEVNRLNIPLSDITETGEAKNRLQAQTIAEYIANLIVDLKDYTRKYNDYGYMRAYSEDDIMIVWNSEWVNKINKLDLPTIFNKAGLMDKFDQNILPARFFAEITTAENVAAVNGLTVSGNTVTIGNSYSGPAIITRVEGDFGPSGSKKHLIPGEKLPVGATFTIGEAEFVDSNVIAKVITKDTIKYMAAFETAGEFYNPQALLSNHILIWGFSDPTRVKGEPCITVHAD